ncbi:MAG: flagellar biosynthetic protein FliR [Alphaproteobacteria bacterium]|nr:flagellar biosynthetic protein FliR [Alphaproteobacteria bacterium]MBF0129541.1 flagellar biosynthetic protein FliR [Alphaproteobacteria bacterium]
MLDELLSLDVYRFLLVFTRLGVVVQMIPGMSAPYVLPQFRLALALAISLLVLPVVAPTLPPQPENATALFLLIAGEAAVGVFLGLISQLLMTAINFAGAIIGFTSGMANATVFDPISEEQGAMVIGFMGNVAVLLIFTTGLHGLILGAVVDSYTLFKPGGGIMIGDMSKSLVSTLDHSFLIGAQFASPFILGSMVFQMGLGVMSRLMPAMNVLFVGLPFQLLLSFALFVIVLPPIMQAFLVFFRDGLTPFLAPG